MASATVERAVTALDRVVPAVCGLARGITWLAGAAGAAVLLLVVVATWARVATPLPAAVDWTLVVVGVGLLLVPPAWLLGTRMVLESLLALPDRLRTEPDLRRDQAAQLAALARARSEIDPAAAVPTGRRLWRAGRLVLDARGDLLAYVGLVRVVSPLTLALTVGAVILAVLEVLILPAIALGVALW